MPHSRHARHARLLPRFAAIALLMVASATLVSAHDFWLVPDAFAVTPGGRIAVNGQTSSLFPTSLSAATPDRVVAALVITADTTVTLKNVVVSGRSMRLDYRPATAGQHLIGVQLAPRTVRESPASFKRYLDLEGAPEARVRYEREGLLSANGGDSLTRRYAKYAKTVVEVGRGARAYTKPAGHPLEFMPLSDPSALRVGDTLHVRLVMLGQPVSNGKFHAGSAAIGATALRDTAAARRSASRDVDVTTDADGHAAVVMTRVGLWNLRTIQIVPALKGSGADWEVHWATLVFAVSDKR